VKDYTEADWKRYVSAYYELIEKVDNHLGRILDALEARGLRERTLVVYTSDHGDMAGSHGLPFKGPFMYDELLRVPFIVSWPDTLPQGVPCNELVSNIDVAPTLCAAGNIDWPERFVGRDLATLFKDPTTPWRDEIFAEYYAKQHWANPIRTVRTQRWKYNLYLDGGEELYDLSKRPLEVHNLAGAEECRAIQEDLSQRLLTWRRETEDPFLRA